MTESQSAKLSGPRVILVLSTGRTGTKAFAAHLNKLHSDIRALHEPAPSRSLRNPSFSFLSGNRSRAEAMRCLIRARTKLIRNTHQSIYIECNPALSGFIEILDDVFEEPQILHLVRDPRTYVRSAINFGSLFGMRDILTRVLPYWILKPEHVDPATELRWSSMNDIQRLSWFWSVVNRHLDKGAQLFGNRYQRVRFEDLFNPEHTAMKETLQWFKLPNVADLHWQKPAKQVNASTVERCPKYSQWTATETQQLLYFCQDQMKEYGYNEDEGLSRSPQPFAA